MTQVAPGHATHAQAPRGPRLRGRRPGTLSTCRALLALATVVQGAFVLVLTREQWFETDALQYIVTRGGDPAQDQGLLVAYGGHWQVLPILIFRGLFSAFGGTYWPYVVMALAIHALLCWAIFELLTTLKAAPVIALVSTWVLLFYGQGADVYMSDAPFPLSLATMLAFWSAVALERTDYSRRGASAAVVMLVAAIMTSGAGIAGAVFVFTLAVMRRRVRTAVVVVLPAAVIFVAWYLTFGRDGGRVRPPNASVLDIPEWLVTGLPGALERAFGVPGTGIILILCLVFSLLAGVLPSSLRAVGAAGLVAAVTQMTLSAIGAIVLGPQASLTGRYTYLAMAFMLPALACALTVGWGLIRQRRSEAWVGIVATAVVLVPVTVQAVALQRDQADGRRLFSKVYKDWVQGAIAGVNDGERILTRTPDTEFNRNVDMAVLTSDALRPRLTSGAVDAKSRLNAENRFMVYVGPQDQDLFLPAFTGVTGFDDPSEVTGPGCHPMQALLLQDQVVKLATGETGNQFGMTSDSTKVTTRLRRGTIVSDETTWDVSAGPVFVASSAKGAVLEVVFDAEGDYTFCHQ